MKIPNLLLFSATMFLNDYQKEFVNEFKKNDEAHHSLKSLLTELKIEDKQFVISNGLEYWRMQFKTRIFQYQGDAQYYEMFSRSIRKGLSLTEAAEAVKRIIDREIHRLEEHHRWRMPYSLNLF